ncbi:MAG: F0F1 ATP synthase subunit epsilon [Pyrinomonadaceae bacterium]
MAEQIKLDVITPQRRVLSEQVETVVVPGKNGELGILPAHTPLISQLQAGILTYEKGGTMTRLLVSGGFVEVSADQVSVLADIAEFPNEVDVNKAREDRDRVEKMLGTFPDSTAEMDELQSELRLAQARLQLNQKT